MILKESLFNKAVFKTTLRRFKWGSILYFVLLFLIGPFMFLTHSAKELQSMYADMNVVYEKSVIFQGGYIVLHILLACAVSTVVALLVYGFVHSPRQGIFMHSLPVSRKANYFSSLCASFVLMMLPVLANGLIFVLMSVFGYGRIIGIIASCVWVLINLFALFVMFSVSSLCGIITGNGFALVGINAAIHILPFVFYLTAGLIGQNFIYGYDIYGEESAIFGLSPIYWMLSEASSNHVFSMLKSIHALLFFVLAVLLYFLTYAAYKNRRIELCGDVAGFSFLKPVFKYTVTAFACILTLSLFQNEMNPVFLFLTAGIISMLAYFISEAVLRKSMRVFDSYKGFVGFLACICIITLFSAYTHFFGYEIYVPEAGETDKVSVYTYYNYDVPYVTDKGVIKSIVSSHENIVKNIPVTVKDDGLIQIHFIYNLRNGKTVKRTYLLSESATNEILGKAFEDRGYKNELVGFSHLNASKIGKINFDNYYGSESYGFIVNDDSQMLMDEIKKDFEPMTYEEFSKSCFYQYDLGIDISREHNENKGAFINTGTENYYWFNLTINSAYKNTIAFLKEKGYNDYARNAFAGNMYIDGSTFTVSNGKYTHKGKTNEYDEFIMDTVNMKKLSFEDAAKIIELSKSLNRDDVPKDGNYYYIFCHRGGSILYSSEKCCVIPSDNIPDYLKKYLK